MSFNPLTPPLRTPTSSQIVPVAPAATLPPPLLHLLLVPVGQCYCQLLQLPKALSHDVLQKKQFESWAWDNRNKDNAAWR